MSLSNAKTKRGSGPEEDMQSESGVSRQKTHHDWVARRPEGALSLAPTNDEYGLQVAVDYFLTGEVGTPLRKLAIRRSSR